MSNVNRNGENVDEAIRVSDSSDENDVKPNIKMEENAMPEHDENLAFRIFNPNEERYNEPTVNESLSNQFHGLPSVNESENANELVRVSDLDEEDDVKPNIKAEEKDGSEQDENHEFRIFNPNDQHIYNEPMSNEVEMNVNNEEEEIEGDVGPSSSRNSISQAVKHFECVE